MTKRRRVFFRIGAWAAVATAAIHMAGQLAPRPAPANETEATLFELMATYRKDVGAGVVRAPMDFLNGFSVSFALMLAWIGVMALFLLRRRSEDAALLGGIARIGAVFSAGLLAVCIVDFFLPPAVCVAVMFAGFAGASPGRAS